MSRYDASRMPPEMGHATGGLPMTEENNMYGGGDDHRKTHSRFPNAQSRMVVNSEKRPGSAQAQRHMDRRLARGKK